MAYSPRPERSPRAWQRHRGLQGGWTEDRDYLGYGVATWTTETLVPVDIISNDSYNCTYIKLGG